MRFLARVADCLLLIGLSVGSIRFCAADDRAHDVCAMSWNIWHGGKEDGEELGPQRVVEVIRNSQADVVAMQESYGSGERIAEALGFQLHARGTNVSILSRFPVVEDISVFEEFKCVGGLIALPGGQKVAFYSIWLPYDEDIWKTGSRDAENPQAMLDACRSSVVDLLAIRDAIFKRLAEPKYHGVPIIIAGDFNSMSHLDYEDIAWDQYGMVVDWPTSHVLIDAGFRDAYREQHPAIVRLQDRTWTPRFPQQEQDRIDFIYYKGEAIESTGAQIIGQHPAGFPSDHAAVVAQFRFPENSRPASESEICSRVVSYNIKHCRGMDNIVNWKRTADTLRALKPDIVGLQEVDLRATRSNSVNQAYELGRALDMHAAFGKIMDFQGGRYGMAILSRYPFRDVRSLPLPPGNEPRIALIAEVRLPNGQPMLVINVHFDWVRDDRLRYGQASALAEFLRTVKMPYLLLGDFNDQPGSRTLNLFHELAAEVTKPNDKRFTFPANQPRVEIDFIFAAPQHRWSAQQTRVIEESTTSDHRPVFSEMTLRPTL